MGDPERTLTYGFALEQAEQMFRAATMVSVGATGVGRFDELFAAGARLSQREAAAAARARRDASLRNSRRTARSLSNPASAT